VTPALARSEVLQWLREENETRLDELWRLADDVRRRHVGDEVHLRGLIELSNHCERRCAYCGLRSENRSLQRYRLTREEVLDSVSQAVALGYGSVVLQAGEDSGIAAEWLADLLRRVKGETPLAVTLSLGERADEELVLWRDAGADRYLLRFETCDEALYEQIHPARPDRPGGRKAMLKRLKALGYETGSGVMIGIPGQTYADLADSLEAFRELDLDMIGVGPYLPHPNTPLGRQVESLQAPPGEQAPNTELMGYKLVALTRIVCPDTNIPSATALATLNQRDGRQLGLARGVNVVMPNLTPPKYRQLHEIYPAKGCNFETPGAFDSHLRQSLAAMGRRVGTGRGDSPKRRAALAD